MFLHVSVILFTGGGGTWSGGCLAQGGLLPGERVAGTGGSAPKGIVYSQGGSAPRGLPSPRGVCSRGGGQRP